MDDPGKVFGLDSNLSCLCNARGGFFFGKRALESKSTKRDYERCVGEKIGCWV